MTLVSAVRNPQQRRCHLRIIKLGLTALLAWSSLPAAAAQAPASAPATTTIGTATTGTAGAAHDIPLLVWPQHSDWVNVKTDVVPPARGDGVADDSDAIQAAFGAVKDGSSVYFPPGTYRITHTLNLSGRLLGVLIVGSGRASKLVWDGETGGKMLKINGVAYSRFVGLDMEGRGKAAVGFWYNSDLLFMTEVRHQHLAFRGFTSAGILNDPARKVALSEPMFENCLFEDCARGISFMRHNDYDFTFDGCEFRRCGIGIECGFGNFYARDCHFEDSAQFDITEGSEHGSSVRRCTSLGSNAFVRHGSSVAPLIVQDCHVAAWRDAGGAIMHSGAPLTLFDCAFSDAPANGSPPVGVNHYNQHLLVSGNRLGGSPVLVGGNEAQARSTIITTIPQGKRRGHDLAANFSFLRDKVQLPTKVFDARRDFGAKGDGTTDDTDAIQRTIDAAAAAPGGGAIAYLPCAQYVVKRSLRISGSNYYVGGNGWKTQLLWRGPEGGTTVEVIDPHHVTLQNMAIGQHDAGPMNNAMDIHQAGGTGKTFMTYDNISVFGAYQKKPLKQGLRFTDLGAGDMVLMPHVQGNMSFSNCARATILTNCSYEGTLIVEGKQTKRDGFLGIQSRLDTIVTYGLIVHDSNNFVASDFYMEQSENHYRFDGNVGDPAGRITVQGAKMNMPPSDDPTKNNVIDIDNYHGQIFFGPYEFYIEPKNMRIKQRGEAPVALYLIGCSWYDTKPDFQLGPNATVAVINNQAVGMQTVKYDAPDIMTADTLQTLTLGFDDLRRLGDLDLQLNHPTALATAAAH